MDIGSNFLAFGFYGFDTSFMIFQIMFFLIFILVFGTILVTTIKGIRQWNKNNHSPRLTVPATVVSKRTHVSSHRHRHGTTGMHHTSRSTTYYVTFQVDSGDRMELSMAGQEFGLLVEGDRGKLTFQGTRFLEFQRT